MNLYLNNFEVIIILLHICLKVLKN
jgi:hypothetical protein